MPAEAEVIEQALAQVELGFAAFALQRNGKRPITEHGFKNATTNPDWIRTQLEAPAAGNYGITWPADAQERVLALDLDNGSDGRERPWQDRLLELIGRIGPLPATKATTTPSGGRHAFYRWPAHIPLPAGDELFGFTVRWPGRGYLVGPGSSIDGVTYLSGPTPEIADLPAAWVSEAVATARSPRPGGPAFITIAGGRYEVPLQIPSGRRYAAVRDFVASRYNDSLPVEDLWELVRSRVAPNFLVPKTDEDLRADFDRVTAKIAERLGPPRHSPSSAAIPVGPLEDAALTEFASEPVQWLWPSWLPRGVVTLMDGNPGVSKSTVVADLVARITTGRPWPDETPSSGIPQRVMWITTEDDPGRVLRPRIEAAGGAAELVRFVISEVVFPSGAGGFRELVVQRAAETAGLALVILDPLFSHIDASVRTIADSEMRKGVMNPLAETAEAAGVAILVVRHFNKDSQASALNRGAGSLGGIVGAARALWSVTLDPEDETGETKAIGVAKLNYARAKPPLRYRVIDRVPPGWVTGTVSGIEWLGDAEVSISALMEEDASVADAVPTLREILGKGVVAASTVMAQMRARGFGRDATRGAARRLHIQRAKSGFTGGWTWSLSAEESELTDEPTGVGSEASVQSRGQARAGGNRRPDSSDSSEDLASDGGAGPTDGTDGTDGAPRGRAPARVRETPAFRVIPGGPSPTVTCHFFNDHQAKHARRADGSYFCPICSPDEEAS